jgi:hypothetical protein
MPSTPPFIPWEAITATEGYRAADKLDRERAAAGYFDTYLATTQGYKALAPEEQKRVREDFVLRGIERDRVKETIGGAAAGAKLGGAVLSAGISDTGYNLAQAPQRIAGAVERAAGQFQRQRARLGRGPGLTQADVDAITAGNAPAQPSPIQSSPITIPALQQFNLAQLGERQQAFEGRMKEVGGEGGSAFATAGAIGGQGVVMVPPFILANTLMPGSPLLADAAAMSVMSPGRQIAGAVEGAAFGGVSRAAGTIKAATPAGAVLPKGAAGPLQLVPLAPRIAAAAQRQAVQGAGFAGVSGILHGDPLGAAASGVMGAVMPVPVRGAAPQPSSLAVDFARRNQEFVDMTARGMVRRSEPFAPIPVGATSPAPAVPPLLSRSGPQPVPRTGLVQQGGMNPFLSAPPAAPPARQLPLLESPEIPLGQRVTPSPANTQILDPRVPQRSPEGLERLFRIEVGPDGQARPRNTPATVPVEGTFTPEDVERAMRMSAQAKWEEMQRSGRILPSPTGKPTPPAQPMLISPEPETGFRRLPETPTAAIPSPSAPAPREALGVPRGDRGRPEPAGPPAAIGRPVKTDTTVPPTGTAPGGAGAVSPPPPPRQAADVVTPPVTPPAPPPEAVVGGPAPRTPTILPSPQPLPSVPSDPALSRILDDAARAADVDDVPASGPALGIIAPGLAPPESAEAAAAGLRALFSPAAVKETMTSLSSLFSFAGRGTESFVERLSPAGAKIVEMIRTARANRNHQTALYTAGIIDATRGSGLSHAYWTSGEFGAKVRAGVEIRDPGQKLVYDAWRRASSAIANTMNHVTGGKVIRVEPHIDLPTVARMVGLPETSTRAQLAEALKVPKTAFSTTPGQWEKLAAGIGRVTGKVPLKKDITNPGGWRPLDPEWASHFPQMVKGEILEKLQRNKIARTSKEWSDLRAANPGKDDSELALLIQESLFTPRFSGFYGFLERPRDINLPESWLDPNDLHVMESYIRSAWTRIFEISQFGKDYGGSGDRLGGQKFRALLGRLEAENPDARTLAVNAAKKIYDGYFLPPERSGALDRLAYYGQNLVVTTKMINFLNAALQLTQKANDIPAYGFRNAIKGLYDISLSASRADNRRMVMHSGAVADDYLRNIADLERSGRWSRLNKRMLQLQGTTPADMEMRLSSARAGLWWLHDGVALLREVKAAAREGKTSTRAVRKADAIRRQMKRMGISDARILEWENGTGPVQTGTEEFMQLAVRFTQFTSDPGSRPVWGHGPVARVGMTLSNFALHQTRFVMGHIVPEARRGNFVPLLTFAASWGIMGEAYTALRNAVTHRERRDMDIADIGRLAMRGEIGAAAEAALQRFIHDLGTAGTFGIIADSFVEPAPGQVRLTTSRLAPVLVSMADRLGNGIMRIVTPPKDSNSREEFGRFFSEVVRKELVGVDRALSFAGVYSESQLESERRAVLTKAAEYRNLDLEWRDLLADWNAQATEAAGEDGELRRKLTLTGLDVVRRARELRE